MDLQISSRLWRSFEQLQLLLRWQIQSPIWIRGYLFVCLFQLQEFPNARLNLKWYHLSRSGNWSLKISFSRNHCRDVVGAGHRNMGYVHTDSSPKEMAATKANPCSVPPGRSGFNSCYYQWTQGTFGEVVFYHRFPPLMVICGWRVNGSCQDWDCMGGCGRAGG